jgi:dihydroorotate dehydrogenase (NAD+) catalytic subunit
MWGFAPARQWTGDIFGAPPGAFTTNPLSLRPRRPTVKPACVPYPGGFLLHTGLPNPGIRAAVKEYARKWANAPVPVIIHLMADRPEETARMVQELEGLENIMAIELGFAPQLSVDIPPLSVELALGELPLIVCLPYEQILTLGPRCVDAGASAISIAAPRGRIDDITGRLYGPALYPQTLSLVHDAARLGLPIIGGGGVYKREQAEGMLNAGALAVQVDASLWRV